MKKFTLFFVALLISMTAFARDIYFDPWHWTSDNAKFTAWVWGGGAGNGVMVAVNYDEVSALYKCTIADDATNMLFLRKSSQSLDWNNEWNRTEDLSIPVEQNKFTVTTWTGGKDGKSSGSWSTYTPAVTPEPEPDPEPTTYTVYFDNNGTGWTTVNAYCWNASGNNSWPGVAMTDVNADGIYEFETTIAYDNIIFSNNGSTQTIDLTFPKDVNNLFKITGESGGKKTGTWSVYEAPDPSKPTVRFTNLTTTAQLGATVKPIAEVENIENPTFVYTVSYEGGEAITLDENGYSLNDYGVYEFTVVATGDNDVTATATFTVTVELVAVLGSAELCHGYYWERAKENAMYPVDGIYTITYEDVPAGTYEFKVAFGIGIMLGIDNIDAENSTPGFNGTNNISFTLSEVTDIKISYNPETGKVILVGVGLEQFGEFVATSYTLCGSKVIFGDEFNTTLTANDMVETSIGVWSKTYSNVVLEAGNYYYKVAANYAWNVGQYPASGDAILDIKEAGKYNLTFTFEPNKAEGEKLTCVVEKIEAEPTTYTVNFDNTNSGWAKVYAYCWNGEGETAIANAEWPGVELTNPENNVYTYSTTTAYENVIFNAGAEKPQTANLVFENGKPMLLDGGKHFSISHSDEMIAIAFSDSNCGVDIEKIRLREFTTISERMGFEANTLGEFYEEWTKYEAVYKLGKETEYGSVAYFDLDDYALTATSEDPCEDFELFMQD